MLKTVRNILLGGRKNINNKEKYFLLLIKDYNTNNDPNSKLSINMSSFWLFFLKYTIQLYF